MLYKLAQEGFKPAKYFSIDRVFRNEAVDRTHLAEFHQIEGASSVSTSNNGPSPSLSLLMLGCVCNVMYYLAKVAGRCYGQSHKLVF